MPQVHVGDVDLYYEVQGDGFPLVLIRGFGSNADHWQFQVPAFSSAHKTVVFDNRGIGRSSKPDVPFSTSMMAADTIGLMDALGLGKAHILGVSMGGMIAQRLALDYPDRVAGLVLACTHCGGAKAVAPSEEVSKVFAEYVMTGSLEAAAKAAGALFTEDTFRNNPGLIQEYQNLAMRYPNEQAMLIHQYEAVLGHDTFDELPEIKAPTLVLTGDQDVLIPPENSKILAGRIPGARLEVISPGGHQFLIEQAAAFNRTVLDFLQGVNAG